MTGTCGPPFWPSWAAGAAATRARDDAGRPGRNAKASRSVSATPKNFLARNTFERGRGITVLLVGQLSVDLETAAHRSRRGGHLRPAPWTNRRHARVEP